MECKFDDVFFRDEMLRRMGNLIGCSEDITIIIAGLRDLEIKNLSEELCSIHGKLVDQIWDLESLLRENKEKEQWQKRKRRRARKKNSRRKFTNSD